MIKLGLCDDQPGYLEQLANHINNVANKLNIAIEVHTFNSAEAFLSFNCLHPHYFDALLLDILMKQINGIELAKMLRKQHDNIDILFITCSREFALDSYDVNACGYILKPYQTAVIEKQLSSLLNNIKKRQQNTFLIKNNQDLISLNLDNVIYFESNLRKITVTLSDGKTVSFYDKLNDLQQALPVNSFIRCHRSFLVNMRYIKNIIASDLFTTTNHCLPISKQYLNSTRDQFTSYIQSMMGWDS